MNVRKIFFWLHLIAGSIAGVIILVMSLTGLLLTYERQILSWADRGQFRDDPPPAAQRLNVEDLLDKVQEHRGRLPGTATLTIRSDPKEPAELRIGREELFYVNPYTGVVATAPQGGPRAVFQKLTSWHRWLGVEGSGRAAARAITGACNLAFLVLILSGAYLWLPKQWSRQALRPITWFRSGLGGKARDFNWHNVFGLWACVPLFFVVLTALPMSYPWANALLYRMTGSEPPAFPGPEGGPGRGGPPPRRERLGPEQGRPRESAGRPGSDERRPRESGGRPADTAGLNQLWAKAITQAPAWNSIMARVNAPRGEPLVFTIDAGDGGQPQKRSTLSLDPATGNVVRREAFADSNAGRRLRMWARFVHTGEYYGVIGQTIAGLGSAAGVMLVWTGISLALRRFAAWRARRSRRDAVLEPVAAGD